MNNNKQQMEKELLIKMIEHANATRQSKRLSNLALQIAVDPELGDDVTIEDFLNESYIVRDITNIKRCIMFTLA